MLMIVGQVIVSLNPTIINILTIITPTRNRMRHRRTTIIVSHVGLQVVPRISAISALRQDLFRLIHYFLPEHHL